MGNETEIVLGKFQGEHFLTERLQKCIIHACQEGMNNLIFCDVDFTLWPLSDASVLDALTQWARSTSNQRKLTVVAATYKTIERQHGSWRRWRQNWSHRIECLQLNDEFDAELPCVFWADHVMLSLQSKELLIGLVQQERTELVAMRSQLNELVSRSSLGFPATTLGL